MGRFGGLRRKATLTILFASLIAHFPVLGVNGAGNLYLSPAHMSLQQIGTVIKIQVRVASFDLFSAWDIQVSADQAVVNSTDISIIGNILSGSGATIYPIVQCINGSGLGCQSTDGMGIIHSAIVGTHTTGGSGLLFTITYKVTGLGYSNIHIFNDIVANGDTQTSISHTSLDADYGINPNNPDFTFTAPRTDLNVTQGSALQSNITLVGLHGFTGMVALSLNSSIAGGLQATLVPMSVQISSGSTNRTVLSIVTSNQTAITQFTITIIGKSGNLQHYLSLHVSVLLPPDFGLGANPPQLVIHAQDTGKTTVFVQSLRGFAGTIHLTTKTSFPGTSTVVPDLTATLDTDTLTISSGENASTTLTVKTPPANITFRYIITVTATSDKHNHSLDIPVIPPSPDFTFTVSALSLSMRPGGSAQLSVTVSSSDYFEGIVYLFATSPSGTKLSYAPPRTPICIVRLLGCSSRTEAASSNLTLTADSLIVPGQHYVILTAIGRALTHSLNITINVLSPIGTASTSSVVTRTILGLQPLTYFGVIAAFGIALAVIAVREVRSPMGRSRRIYLEDSPVPQKDIAQFGND